MRLVEPGQTIENVDFLNVYISLGNTHPGSNSGCKFHDDDADGRIDPDEPGLEGIRIDLFREEDGVLEFLRSTYTNSNGEHSLEDVEPGRYRVREASPDG